MGQARRFVLPAGVMALAAAVAGCSSSQERTPRGSVTLALGASRVAAGVQAANASPGDPLALLKGASSTVAHVEARRSDGSWVPIDRGLPTDVDLMAAADAGRTVTFPPDLLPEGHYDALQLRITRVDLTRLNGTRLTIAPEGASWVVRIPVDFGVASDQATIVGLNVRLDLSIKLVSGELEFEPEVEVNGVTHD